MKHHHFARRLGVLTAGALIVGGLTGLGTGTAQAVQPGADPAPAAASITWLKTQLGDGVLLSGPYGGATYENVGGTIDAALGARVVGDTATVTALRDAVAARVGSYTGTEENTSAGGTAKAAFLAQQSGANASSFGGIDLIAKLAPQVISDGPSAGRLQDDVDTSDQFDADYANVLSQAYAVAALTTAGQAKAPSATSFLVKQQCTAGYFTGAGGFAQSDKTAADQTCDGNAAPASVDATAIAVVALSAQSGAAVKASVERAVAWLRSVQAADGSFRPAGNPGAGNASSTGYAGWALGTAGSTAAAQNAASWIRGQQLANAGSCTTYAAADNGAVAQNTTSLGNVRTTPIGSSADGIADEFRVATAQTLAALAWVPGGPGAGETTIELEKFVKAGTASAVANLTGARGNTLCVTPAGAAATKVVLDGNGRAAVTLALPATHGRASLTAVDAGGESDSASVSVLAKKKVKFTVQAAGRIPALTQGTKALVKVRGLQPGERIQVKLAGKKVTSVANAKGRKTVRIKVTGKPGGRKLVVKGQFANRTGKTTVRVVP